MGDIQREKSKDPIISEPTYIHATYDMSVCVHVPVTLHIWPNQPTLCLHSGMCGDDIIISSLADRSRVGSEGMDVVCVPEDLSSRYRMEGTEWNWSSPDSLETVSMNSLNVRCQEPKLIAIVTKEKVSYSKSKWLSERHLIM
jgi:hypothetical protein